MAVAETRKDQRSASRQHTVGQSRIFQGLCIRVVAAAITILFKIATSTGQIPKTQLWKTNFMELRHLRHFVSVAEELHFARAAERLGMEQSPLSHSIRNLESELGVRLFQRTTRRTWLTRAGMRFYQEARRILRDIDAAMAAALRNDADEPMVVRLALGEDLASEPFTRLLFELEHHIPKVELEVRELLHTETARLVRDRAVDLAITLNGKPESELARVRGWSEPLMIVAPIGHAFAERDRVSLTELRDQTLALPTADECPGYLAQVEALLSRHQVRIGHRVSVRHWNTAVSFAATGRAVALCPTTMVHTSSAVAIIPIAEADAELTTWLLYREDELCPAVSLVLDVASELAEDAPFLADAAV